MQQNALYALVFVGLDGLPLALIFTSVSLFGWLLSYFVVVLWLQPMGLIPGLLGFAIGCGLILVASLVQAEA